MPKKALLIVALLIILAGALGNAGCSSSGNGPQDMLAKVPEGVFKFQYMDIKAMRNDGDLEPLYEAWETAVDARFNSHGINPADVELMVFATSLGVRITVLDGRFALDNVRDDLEDAGYAGDDYKDVEVWSLPEGTGFEPDRVVALMDNLIILGNASGVQGCIQVVKGEEDPLGDEIDIKDVISRTPSAPYIDINTQWTGILLGGIEAYALTYRKADSSTLQVNGVAKFDFEGEEKRAENAADVLETWLDAVYDSVEVDYEGDYVKAAAELDIDDAEFLFNGV